MARDVLGQRAAVTRGTRLQLSRKSCMSCMSMVGFGNGLRPWLHGEQCGCPVLV